MGRFLNADDYVSTGGILGYNMLAYCCNNPVMLIDKSGQIPDSFAGGIGQDLGELIYEWLTGEERPSKAAEEKEKEISQKQNKLIRDGAIVLWDAYILSIELEAEAQHQQAMRIISETEYIISDPWRTTDLVTGVAGLGLTYIGYAAAAAGVSIPVVGQVAMGVVGLVCGVYGIMRILYPSENKTQNMP